ncbi:MAG: hypothetical protein AAF533_04685 [Acidobacteriota bacterium]
MFKAICEVNGLNDGAALEAMVDSYLESLDGHERHLVRGAAQLVMDELEARFGESHNDDK